MKKVLFLTSHLHSGSGNLFESLDKTRRVQGHRLHRMYTHPSILEQLTGVFHKTDNTAAIYMDELLHNYVLSTKTFYSFCKFIYVVREPRPTLNSLIGAKLYKPLQAARYYTFRLRRMCEMARNTPGAVLATWEDLTTGRANPLIEDYLNLREQLPAIEELPASRDICPFELIQQAEKSYEKYLFYLRSQKLVYWA
jgi:hypothetical protein